MACPHTIVGCNFLFWCLLFFHRVNFNSNRLKMESSWETVWFQKVKLKLGIFLRWVVGLLFVCGFADVIHVCLTSCFCIETSGCLWHTWRKFSSRFIKLIQIRFADCDCKAITMVVWQDFEYKNQFSSLILLPSLIPQLSFSTWYNTYDCTYSTVAILKFNLMPEKKLNEPETENNIQIRI